MKEVEMTDTKNRDVPAALARLGIEELEERLETSPLLGDDVGDGGCCNNFCQCKLEKYPEAVDDSVWGP
jgi:hypothetical protein